MTLKLPIFLPLILLNFHIGGKLGYNIKFLFNFRIGSFIIWNFSTIKVFNLSI